MMRRATFYGAVAVSALCGALAFTTSGEQATKPAQRPATITTATTPPTPYCDIDWCAVPDVKGTGEWVVYVTGHNQIAMFHQAYPTEGLSRDAS